MVRLLEVCLSDPVQDACQKLVRACESLKYTKPGDRGNKRGEELIVQTRILDAGCLLGASRPVRVKGENRDEGRSEVRK